MRKNRRNKNSEENERERDWEYKKSYCERYP